MLATQKASDLLLSHGERLTPEAMRKYLMDRQLWQCPAARLRRSLLPSALANYDARFIAKVLRSIRAQMAPFTHHIFICCNQRPPGAARPCCDPEGSQVLKKRFKEELRKQNCGPLVRSSHSGCLDQCELGPTVVIYPDGIWYGGVKPEDVPRIVEKTIKQGLILEDLHIAAEKLNSFSKSESPARKEGGT